MIPLFKEEAARLLQEKDAEEIVAAALATISGVTEMTKRSLLSSIKVSLGVS